MGLSFLALMAVLTGPFPAMAAGDQLPPDLAARAWAVTGVVVARHVDSPTRQQMILDGVKAICKTAKMSEPVGLAARVSAIQAPESLAAILAEAWPKSLPADVDQAPEDIFIDGMLAIVPGGAELLSGKERKVAEQVEANLYVGIQVALKQEGGRPAFQQILPGGPADRVGAKADDVIDAIDGVSTEGMKLAEVVDRIRGEAGTEVVIRLRRVGVAEPFDRPMIRGTLPRVTVEGVSARPAGGWNVRLDGPLPIGYLKIKEVVGSTPRELRAFAAQLEIEGVRALVLDLRPVSQAGFHPTVLLADALLDGGVIGRVRESETERVIQADPDALFRDWPIVVLAGEPNPAEVQWLCAGLEDNHRATVIGSVTRTSGDAGVRTSVALPVGDWSVKMVTGRLVRGNGRPLMAQAAKPRFPGVGQTPNFAPRVVPLDPYTAEPVAPPNPSRFRNLLGVPENPEDLLIRARVLLGAALQTADSPP